MHRNKQIAIILSDTLRSIGLQSLLTDYFPPVEVCYFPNFEMLSSTGSDTYDYYFTDSDTLVLNADFFLPRRNKTALLIDSTEEHGALSSTNRITLRSSQETIIEQLQQLFTSDSSGNTTTENNKDLSSREVDVLQLIVKGITNKEIADKLNISLNTVLTHRKNITAKLGIKTVSGGISVLEPSRTLFIVLKTPVISKAIYLGSSNIYKVTSFQENSDLAALPQLTLEARVYMLGFQTRDPYISSIMGIEGICGVRFGDVKVDPDCIQICHDSYQPAATDKPFDKEKWYHVAAVWTGSSWDIYINGQYATGVETQGETIDLTSDNSGGFYLGASYGGGRTLNGYVAECRVWTRALSQSEIANNMNYVDPTSDGLLAYWRMNAWEPNDSGSGNIVRDLTGHGYDAVGGSSNPTMMDTKWN